MMKLIWLYFFSLLFVSNTQKNVFIKTIDYVTKKPVASTVLVFDTYQNKLDSFAVSKEGVVASLPDKELVFVIQADESLYRRKAIVISLNGIIDSLSIEIDPKTLYRCPSLRPIHFRKNSCIIDSADLISLNYLRNFLIQVNTNSIAKISLEMYVSTDVGEKNTDSLQVKRAEAVINVLQFNTNIQCTVVFERRNTKPKKDYEHIENRSAAFKIRNMWSEDLDIQVDDK